MIPGSNSKFHVLALDGGGIRGAFSARFLECLTLKGQVELDSRFDLIVGTSTGAILAASIACGIDISRVVDFYKTRSKDIFRKRRFRLPERWDKLLRSTYNIRDLQEELSKVFEGRKLGEVKKPLILPAADIGNGSVHLFKSGYDSSFSRDMDVTVSEAVAASCAAPTYFDPVLLNDYLVADGGLWANSPALAGATEAIKRFQVRPEDLLIVSIGTGTSTVEYKFGCKKWGLATGWQGKRFIDYLLSLQLSSSENYLRLMIGEDKILRINFSTDKNIELDDHRAVADCISKADQVYSYRSSEIRAFLQ